MKVWQANSEKDFDKIASEILEYAATQKKFALHGEMGSGKTTLIKAMCRKLGVEDVTSSPTFAIVNEYEGKEKIYHFDLFRIRDKKELNDIGFEEFLQGNHYVFIEWPELAESILWHYNTAKISIEVSENLERIITLER